MKIYKVKIQFYRDNYWGGTELGKTDEQYFMKSKDAYDYAYMAVHSKDWYAMRLPQPKYSVTEIEVK